MKRKNSKTFFFDYDDQLAKCSFETILTARYRFHGRPLGLETESAYFEHYLKNNSFDTTTSSKTIDSTESV
jgi:hypothetical protein